MSSQFISSDAPFTIYKDNFNSNNITDESCRIYDYESKAINFKPDNKIGLWPNLVSHEQLKHGKILFGFRKAINTIRKHQNSQNCSTAKYLVSYGFQSGFGSRIHVEASGFTIAFQTNRIYLSHIHIKNPIQNEFCIKQGKDTLECYYLPWSKCTLKDAGIIIPSPTKPISKKSFLTHYNHNNLKQQESIKTLLLVHDAKDKFRDIPSQFHHLLSCSPIQPKYYYYWWRALTATYLLRPNNATINELKRLDTLQIHSQNIHNNPNQNQSIIISNNNNKQNIKYISIYVRYGDKSIEMELVKFDLYFQTAIDLWKKELVQNNNNQNNELIIFLGTETPSIIQQAIEWSLKTNITVIYTNIFDRSIVSASLDFKNQHAIRKSPSFRYHELEYLNILLNLYNSLKCDAWICTLASNYCRIIDELRATIGGKANYHFVDLSKESCNKVPCYNNENHSDLGWR